jgi:hypothetical protein
VAAVAKAGPQRPNLIQAQVGDPLLGVEFASSGCLSRRGSDRPGPEYRFFQLKTVAKS